MFETLLVLLALGAGGPPMRKPPAPQPQPQIVLYTIGPGETLFERFGHAALCVIYERQPGQSRCYNYGTAEFSDPLELGWKFLRGTARFWVSQWRPGAVVSAYQKSDRSVWRQQLALGPEATQKIVERLEHDAAPKNRYYRYHHFDDNCATRLRDIIDASTQGALRRHHTEAMARSFRELTAPRLADQPGLVALGSVLTGRRLEQHPTFYEGMFLPEVLRKGVYDAFGAEPELVYARRGPELEAPLPSLAPWFLGATLLTSLPVLCALALEPARPKARHWLFMLSAVLLSTIGLAVWGVAALSTIPELRANEAVLIFTPTDLLIGILKGRARTRYAALRVVLLLIVSGLLALGVLRQPLELSLLVALVPCALVLLAGRGSSRDTGPSAASQK